MLFRSRSRCRRFQLPTSLALLCVVFALTNCELKVEPNPVPAMDGGIDTYKHGYVFVTSGTFPGDRFSRDQADKLCATIAQSTQINSNTTVGSELKTIKTWTAWLSYFDAAVIYSTSDRPGSAGDAINRLKIILGYSINDNPKIRWYGTNWDGTLEKYLFGLPMDSIAAGPLPGTMGVRFDEHGRNLATLPLMYNPTMNVWTGTRGSGAQVDVTKTCLSYTTSGTQLTDAKSWASQVGSGVVGSLREESTGWTEVAMGSNLACTQPAHLYCFGLVP